MTIAGRPNDAVVLSRGHGAARKDQEFKKEWHWNVFPLHGFVVLSSREKKPDDLSGHG